MTKEINPRSLADDARAKIEIYLSTLDNTDDHDRQDPGSQTARFVRLVWKAFRSALRLYGETRSKDWGVWVVALHGNLMSMLLDEAARVEIQRCSLKEPIAAGLAEVFVSDAGEFSVEKMLG